MSKPLAHIPYGKHIIDDLDIESVVDVLSNKFLTQGTTVPEFEQAISEYCGVTFTTAVNSATSGLHVACLALGVSAGDWVWTVPNSFVASANCARYCGASVDFVDIDPVTRNISIAALEQKLVIAKQQKKLPKALIVVHFSGLSCDMQAISELLKPFNIRIVEDAAHALGGSYQGKKIGCCEFSDMAVLSFHPVKSITSAEGGAVLTNDPQLDAKIKLFAKHGITRDPQQMMGDSEGPWYYQQVELGYNYRLSDLHAALGLSQLRKLDGFIKARQIRANRYYEALQGLPLRLPVMSVEHPSAWHLFMLELTRHDRKSVFNNLVEKGIGVNVHYIPIHLHPYYQSLGFKRGDFPNAEAFYQNALTIPLFPSLSADEQHRVIQSIRKVLT